MLSSISKLNRKYGQRIEILKSIQQSLKMKPAEEAKFKGDATPFSKFACTYFLVYLEPEYILSAFFSNNSTSRQLNISTTRHLHNSSSRQLDTDLDNLTSRQVAWPLRGSVYITHDLINFFSRFLPPNCQTFTPLRVANAFATDFVVKYMSRQKLNVYIS